MIITIKMPGEVLQTDKNHIRLKLRGPVESIQWGEHVADQIANVLGPQEADFVLDKMQDEIMLRSIMTKMKVEQVELDEKM